MIDVNDEAINIKKRLIEIENIQKELQNEQEFLKNKIHLYFDGEQFETSKAEAFIVDWYWQNCYGSEIRIDPIRVNYTKNSLEKTIKKYVTNYNRALDIGCGYGLFTEFMASRFKESIGLDLSEFRVGENNKNNKLENVKYLSDNFVTCDKSKLGKFDFIFASDINMYSSEKDYEQIFNSYLDLLDDEGVLLMRESVYKEDEYKEHKSHRYVAYYKSINYYKNGIYKNYYIDNFRDFSIHINELNRKYFSLFPEKKAEVERDIKLLDDIVKNNISRDTTTSYYYIYKKD